MSQGIATAWDGPPLIDWKLMLISGETTTGSQSKQSPSGLLHIRPCDIETANDEMDKPWTIVLWPVRYSAPASLFNRCIWEYTDPFKLALAYGSIPTLSMCWRTYFDPRKNIWPTTFKDMKMAEIWDRKGRRVSSYVADCKTMYLFLTNNNEMVVIMK